PDGVSKIVPIGTFASFSTTRSRRSRSVLYAALWEITVDRFEKSTFPQYPVKATRHTGRYAEKAVSPANILEMTLTTQKYGIIWQATPRIARIILKTNLP